MILRFNCVWTGGSNINPNNWENQIGITAFKPEQTIAGQFAGLNYLSSVVSSPFEVSREQRKNWAQQLSDSYLPRNVGVSVLGGSLAVNGPKLLVMDADSTLFTSEVIELLAKHAGSANEVSAITSAAMRGELDFTQSLKRRMSTLAGLPQTVLTEVCQEVRFSTGATDMVKALHKKGAKVGVVSGGFIEIVKPKAALLDMDFYAANRFETVEGKLTGRAIGEIVTSEVKQHRLQQWAKQLNIELSQCVAVGDGANDINMMHTAELGIAYCAKPVTNSAADAKIPFPNLGAGAILSGCVNA